MKIKLVKAALLCADMTNQEIVQVGRGKMKDTEDALGRAVRVVADTEAVGAQAAMKLKAQSDQMGKIIDDLNEIDFTMKKASKVIRDITRGLMTDKCATSASVFKMK